MDRSGENNGSRGFSAAICIARPVRYFAVDENPYVMGRDLRIVTRSQRVRDELDDSYGGSLHYDIIQMPISAFPLRYFAHHFNLIGRLLHILIWPIYILYLHTLSSLVWPL